MSEQWYFVPRVGTGTARDPHRPKYTDRFDGYSSYFVEQANRFVVRFFGENAAHDQTQGEDDVESATPKQAADRLNEAFDTNYSPVEWENKLFVDE